MRLDSSVHNLGGHVSKYVLGTLNNPEVHSVSKYEFDHLLWIGLHNKPNLLSNFQECPGNAARQLPSATIAEFGKVFSFPFTMIESVSVSLDNQDNFLKLVSAVCLISFVWS